MKNKNIKKYLSVIKRSIPSRKLRKPILKDLTNELLLFEEQNNNVSYDQLCGHFGNPNELVNSYLLDLSAEEINGKIKYAKKISIIVTSSIIIALSLLIITFAIMIKENRDSQISIETIAVSQEQTN